LDIGKVSQIRRIESIRKGGNMLRQNLKKTSEVSQVLGNNLLFTATARVIESPSENVRAQQEKLIKLIHYFEETINQDKKSKKNFLQNHLGALNFQLFGFLGGVDLLTDYLSDTPFRDYLVGSKAIFYQDIYNMSQSVSKWTFKQDLVIINQKDFGSDLTFRCDTNTMEFFSVLKQAHDFIFTNPTRQGLNYGMELVSRYFGIYPEEKKFDINLQRFGSDFWKPQETANTLKEALINENTMKLVLEVINRTKDKSNISILMDKDLRGTRQVAYEKKNEKPTFIERPRTTTQYLLSVEKEEDLRDFGQEIPRENLMAIENFIYLNASALRDEIPFALHPHFYILSGPVKVEASTYTDPLVLLEFSEFPGTIIPVEAWLPHLKKEKKERLFEVMHVNSLDVKAVFDAMRNKNVKTINPENEIVTSLPILKYPEAKLQQIFAPNQYLR
jgi:hypothetical protein